jgi:hypothetical protein
MVEKDILEYEIKHSETRVINREIVILNFKNPPAYMKEVTGSSGKLQVYKNAENKLSVFYSDKFNYADIKIKIDAGMWSLLIEAVLQYTAENNLYVLDEKENINDKCKNCGEQLITYHSSCRDSYCCELHSEEKCYQCGK